MAAWTRILAEATGTLWIVSLAAPAGAQDPDGTSRGRFYCNTGYSLETCQLHVGQLGEILARFELRQVGDWSWILVRSDDWQPILRRVKRDPDSPAFTILEKRQIFLEEALFVRIAGRDRTLLEKWRMPLHALLEFAVTHELAHAMCGETDEVRAHALARALRQSRVLKCKPSD